MASTAVAGLRRATASSASSASSASARTTSRTTSRTTARTMATRSAAILARPCPAHHALPPPSIRTPIRIPQRRLFQNQPIPPQFQHFSPSPSPSPPSPPPPSPPRRRRFRIFTLNRILFLAATAASYMALAHLVVPRLIDRIGPADPHSPDGRALAARLRREMIADTDSMELVQRLKAEGWDEWAGPIEATESPESRVRVTTGPMGGVDGIGGCHRIFRNRATGEIVSVLYVGARLAGWPMVVHGGALATVLDEALGRCAILMLAAGTAVTARLELKYKRMSLTGGYVAVFCVPELEPSFIENSENGQDAKVSRRKLWCNAQLAPIDARGKLGPVSVEARALFVVPQGYKLPKVEQIF